ncbi:uncharacterized protein V1518DRAFT_413731 [Limtongia smithiae]|uniref:uncharacterized protein n=1 Tax=Limtongia smithiae TaxID=1125753 RepID=UPI0034CD601A
MYRNIQFMSHAALMLAALDCRSCGVLYVQVGLGIVCTDGLAILPRFGWHFAFAHNVLLLLIIVILVLLVLLLLVAAIWRPIRIGNAALSPRVKVQVHRREEE